MSAGVTSSDTSQKRMGVYVRDRHTSRLAIIIAATSIAMPCFAFTTPLFAVSARAENLLQPTTTVSKVNGRRNPGAVAGASDPGILPPLLPDVTITGALDFMAAPLQQIIIVPPALPDILANISLPDITAKKVSPPAEAARTEPTLAIAPPDLPQPAPMLGAIPKTPFQLALGEVLSGAPSLPTRLGKAQREAIIAHYRARQDAPLWLEGQTWSANARDVLATLAKAAEDGLNASDYIAPLVDPLPREGAARVLAEADLRLSALAVLYARDARGGRIDPPHLSKLMTPKLALPGAGEVLDTLVTSGNAAATLAAYHPPHADYHRLKRALANLRAARPNSPEASAPEASAPEASAPEVRVPQGPVVKLGMRDARVPLVRARFGLGPIGDPERATTYDERVASAVADFQREKGLPASGALTRQTIAALGGSLNQRREGDIVANMERWRWLPAELGQRHIIVNIPAFTMKVVAEGNTLHSARVIVGKPQSQTPIFSDEIRHVIINPSWYVPPSIMKSEFLPRLAANPNYAAERGYVVTRDGKTISVRQPPGEKNALGNIKFMFPNHHAVYLHDTPGRHLFASTTRALSHGCVRVDQPMRLAEILLGADWSEAKVRSLVGKGERLVRLPRNVPVHLSYFTLSADAEGNLQSIEDIYGIDRKLAYALGYRG